MHFTVTDSAAKDTKRLPIATQQRLRAKLLFWQRAPQPLAFAKPLTQHREATHRFRLGAYRIIVKAIDKNELRILRIRHRKEVYGHYR